MASTVQTGGGSGVDLSELTSGERLLIGLLGVRIFSNQNKYANINLGAQDVQPIDFTKVESITAYSLNKDTGCNWGRPNKYTLGVIRQNSTTLNKPTSSSGEDNSLTFYCYGENEYMGHVTITAFTTTDGKVHTSSNLNY